MRCVRKLTLKLKATSTLVAKAMRPCYVTLLSVECFEDLEEKIEDVEIKVDSA